MIEESRMFANADAVIIRNGKILLEKRHSGDWGGYWCLPGGQLVQGETIEEGLAREVFEETGFKVKVGKLAGVYSGFLFEGSKGDVAALSYFAEIIGGKKRLQKEEVDEIKWFAKDRLPEKIAFDHRKRIIDGFIATAREEWSLVSVDVVIENGKGEVLMEKRAHGQYRDFWCLPGGHANSGETLEEAAKREVFEETGYKIKLGKLLKIVSGKRYPGANCVTAVFLGKIVGGKPTLQKEETTDLRFFPKSKLPEKIAFDHRKILRDLKRGELAEKTSRN